MPVALPAGRRDATTTCNALIGAVAGMPERLVKTLTWDQGSEMAGHAAFSLATAPTVDVYFAHPHSPWERGTNENTNGLLREYFPKGTEITDDQTYLDLVARELNNRPRRILGYRTPAEVFTDLLASSIASTDRDRPRLGTLADVAALATTTNTWRATQVRRYGRTDVVQITERVCLWYGSFRRQTVRVILVRDDKPRTQGRDDRGMGFRWSPPICNLPRKIWWRVTRRGGESSRPSPTPARSSVSVRPAIGPDFRRS